MSTPAPAAPDPTTTAAREVEAANRAFVRVGRDLLEDALTDILRASARRDGIEL